MQGAERNKREPNPGEVRMCSEETATNRRETSSNEREEKEVRWANTDGFVDLVISL